MRKSRTPSPDSGSGDRNLRDRELFARFIKGDGAAFQALYATYERPLILYCEYLLRSTDEAQDVFQEAWLRVVRLRDRQEEVVVENFRAMLFTIARNISLTRLSSRKQSSSVKLSLDTLGADGDWLATEGEPFGELEDLVNRALARLPVLQREAFVLHGVLGYTFQEIAEKQGGTMTAAKTRAFRARAYLRKLVSNWLGLAEDDDGINDDEPHRVAQSPLDYLSDE
jgi:RNA polymerase sigma-70 factor (ECF subfamily)